MCRPLESVSLKDLPLDLSMCELRQALASLKEIISDSDFSDPAHIQQIKLNIVYIKSYYERLERGLRYGND